MPVDAVNHRQRDGATETTALGPFYVGEHEPMPHGRYSGRRMIWSQGSSDAAIP
jgi:hypothetical protein